ARTSPSAAGGRVRRRAGLGERSLRRCQPRERDAERRAADVVEPKLVAERDRLRLAAVLAADAELQLRLGRAAALDPDTHQIAHSALVERLERVALEHALLEVVGEELALGVVAGKTERRLGEVVRPEGEEVRLAGDLVRTDTRAR